MSEVTSGDAGAGGSCVAIGVFDGVHLGHQAVLAGCRAAADAARLRAVGLTFDPHPLAVVRPERAPLYLSSVTQRLQWMTAPGLVREAVAERFDAAFAALSAREFVERVLVGRLRARQVRIGADFRFGRDREAGAMELEAMGSVYGFSVGIVSAVASAGERISSTQIRRFVAAGDVSRAAPLLGRRFAVRGTVVRGKQLGRTIGYPTINVRPEMGDRQLMPSNGVYGGYAARPDAPGRVRAAISVGFNPTTDHGEPALKLEAYLMDGFSSDLYGATVDVEFAERLRDEARFDSLGALVEQIDADVRRVGEVVPAG